MTEGRFPPFHESTFVPLEESVPVVPREPQQLRSRILAGQDMAYPTFPNKKTDEENQKL